MFDKNILERYIMRFDSYAEASQEKERISKIRNTTSSNNNNPNKSAPRTLTKRRTGADYPRMEKYHARTTRRSMTITNGA
jgi:hypothetical protein